MIDQSTLSKLAELRRQIGDARNSCGGALEAMSRARGQAAEIAAASPFLADCAKELEALAGVMRLAADRAGDGERAA